MRNDRHIASLVFLLGILAAEALQAVPPNEPPLPDSLISDNAIYQLRYDNNAASTHFVPDSLIVGAADALDRNGAEQTGNPRGYHDGFLDLGFSAPWFSGNPVFNDVTFWDCDNPPGAPGDLDCDNGFATLDQIVLPAPKYRARSEACVRMILGHELFHHVEFGYVNAGGRSGCGKVLGTAVCEGQARAMQDKIYFDQDLDPAASCVASFDGQADGYLDNPDITIWSASYSAALFWTYLMEQYGSINSEPNYGADFITAWWELATDEVDDPNVYDITRRTIQMFAPTHSLVNAYQDFTIANLVKDLSVLAIPAVQRARYTYVDDGPVLAQTNLNHFGKVDVDFFATVPVNGAAAIELQAQRFGGDYSRFDLSACPAGRQVEFSVVPQFLLPLDPNAQTPAPDALISLVLTKGFDGLLPSKLYKWRGQSAKASFLQPNSPYTRGFVIVSGWHGSYPGVLTMRCQPAPLAPIVTLTGNQPQPGPGAQPIGSIAVDLPSGAAGGNPIGGLNASDFSVQIGGLNAPIRTAVREGDGYRLHFAHPAQSGPGPFALSVQAAAQTTTIANAIRYDQPEPEVIVVLDLSASMGQPVAAALLLPAVQKIREAAARMKSTARFGLIGHFGNGSEPNRDAVVLLPLAALSAAHRANLESVLGGLSASTNSSSAPGDAILTAEDQFTANGGNGPRSILMIGDGAQGEGAIAALAIPALIRARASLTAIALGGLSDQPLLQSLTLASNGNYHYVPTTAAGMDRAAFDLAFEAAHSGQTREHVLLARQVNVPAAATIVESLALDAALVDGNGGASFSAMVRGATAPAPVSIRLFRPNASEVVAGSGVEIISTARGRVFHLDNAPTGIWQLQIVGGSAAPTGAMDVTVLLDEGRGPAGKLSFARPDGDEMPLDTFKLGEPVDVHYLTYKLSDALISSVTAMVERPDGSTVNVPLLPQPTRDGFAASETAVFGARLDLQTLGSATGIADDGSATAQRGSYRVVAQAHYGDAAGGSIETTTASFAVQNTSSDSDTDGLPDRYESAHVCLNAAQSASAASTDSDGDGLNNANERLRGTDPCSVDSDDGGETDASEVAFGANPLDRNDDALAPITHAEILRRVSGHEDYEPLPPLANTIAFDSDPRYDQVLVKVGVGTLTLSSTTLTINANAAQGRFVHSGLTAGQTYCYQLTPRTSTGRSGAASEILCSVARADMTAPTGSLVLNDGAAQSRGNTLTAHIELDNESATGAQMNVQLPDGSESGWVPFQSTYLIPVSGITRPGSVRVSVVLRDATGNESEGYGDDILLIDNASAGSISGNVRGAGLALTNALIRIENANTLAPALTAANGDFSFVDLPPGTYTLVFSYAGYQDALRSNVVVSGGGTVSLGTIDLVTISPLLFGNGFE